MPPSRNKLWKKPKYVKLYESNGQAYAYYRRHGVERRIDGEPGTREWVDNYETIHRSFQETHIRAGPAPNSLDAAIIAYKQSDRFRILATSTKSSYDWLLNRVSDQLGHLPLTSFTRRSIVRLQAKMAETAPKNAIETVKVLRNVFETACDLGEINENPAKEVRKPAGYRARQFEAWTDEQIAIFLAGAKPVWRRAAMVALYTGLRRSDLIRLNRGHIKNGWIVIDILKTHGHAEIPIHSDLMEELNHKLPVTSLMLVPTARGTEMEKGSLSHGIRLECRRLGIQPNPPLHGLRRNAIIRLLEAGCSREEVTSITDQSESMVKHYAGRRHKRVLAESAILKLEDAKRRR